MSSLAQRFAALPIEQRQELMKTLTEEEAEQLLYRWDFWARPEQLAPEGNWSNLLVCAGRGFGKEICLKTPIPTPSGWSTMGDILVGDKVFDEMGQICTVQAKFYPESNEQYRLAFSDGSQIEAGIDHQWVTWTHRERKAFLRSAYEDSSKFPESWPQWRAKRDCSRSFPPIGPQIRTTHEIIETLRVGKRRDTNHCIPCCRPLVLPEAELPVPPYTLGIWLGNGSSADGSIHHHEDDMPFVRSQIERDGFQTTPRKHPQTFGTLGLRTCLQKANLLENKHIPGVYLRGSIEQRLALLNGLMDADGGVDYGSTVSFCNTNRNLIDATAELVQSLGMKCTITSGVGKYDGKTCKPFWRVCFTPTINPFSMPRKANRITLGGNQSLRNYHRMIVSAERIAPTQMACITVDSPNSMYLVGRGMIPTHNTRMGAEWVRSIVCGDTPLGKGKCERVAIVGETAADCRDVLVEGDSGILSVHPKSFRPLYQPSIRRLTWPNGATASLYNATEPSQLRGPQHGAALLDELCKWQYAQETWDMLQFGLRLGTNPQQVITTTPRPLKLLKTIMALPGTIIRRGSTLDNRLNLAPSFITNIVDQYAGTRLGRQELDAEILDDVPGALWSRTNLDEHRVKPDGVLPDMQRIVVAIDPAMTSSTDGDTTSETGIIVAGLGVDGRGYILDDRSCRLSPKGWAQVAVMAYDRYEADFIVAEVNQGGEMVQQVIQSIRSTIKVKMVRATRGKVVRAEPISALYEQGRISHVGTFPLLEDQMMQFTTSGVSGDGDADRVDSCVWACTELFPSIVGHAAPPRKRRSMSRRLPSGSRSSVTGY